MERGWRERERKTVRPRDIQTETEKERERERERGGGGERGRERERGGGGSPVIEEIEHHHFCFQGSVGHNDKRRGRAGVGLPERHNAIRTSTDGLSLAQKPQKCSRMGRGSSSSPPPPSSPSPSSSSSSSVECP